MFNTQLLPKRGKWCRQGCAFAKCHRGWKCWWVGAEATEGAGSELRSWIRAGASMLNEGVMEERAEHRDHRPWGRRPPSGPALLAQGRAAIAPSPSLPGGGATAIARRLSAGAPQRAGTPSAALGLLRSLHNTNTYSLPCFKVSLCCQKRVHLIMKKNGANGCKHVH